MNRFCCLRRRSFLNFQSFQCKIYSCTTVSTTKFSPSSRFLQSKTRRAFSSFSNNDDEFQALFEQSTNHNKPATALREPVEENDFDKLERFVSSEGLMEEIASVADFFTADQQTLDESNWEEELDAFSESKIVAMFNLNSFLSVNSSLLDLFFCFDF